jgi:hypothetical protein
VKAPHTDEDSEVAMSRPANADMIEGFQDGYDLTAPEPSANRSASYRHGFMCGRIDKGQTVWTGTADDLRKLADEAMQADAVQQTPGA